MVFDPSGPMAQKRKFERKKWAFSEFGHFLEEIKELPPNMTQPREVGVTTRAKVDTDHAADAMTRR